MEAREFQDAVYAQLARMASAFASAKRLEIIDVLAQGERPVDSLAAETGCTMANASRHLQVLRNAGIVGSRREGQHVIYRIADPAVLRGYQALRDTAGSLLIELNHLADAFFSHRDDAEPVSIASLVNLMEAGQVIVVDVRPQEEFAAGHVAGAVNIPLPDIADRIDTLPADAEIVAYCRGTFCVLASEAVKLLREGGRHATRLEVGFPEWQLAGLPVATT